MGEIPPPDEFPHGPRGDPEEHPRLLYVIEPAGKVDCGATVPRIVPESVPKHRKTPNKNQRTKDKQPPVSLANPPVFLYRALMRDFDLKSCGLRAVRVQPPPPAPVAFRCSCMPPRRPFDA